MLFDQKRGDAPPKIPALFKMALLTGVKSAVEFHIRRGACLDARDDQGRSALHLAAEKGFADICLTLLAAGADASATTHNGETPCDIAIRKGRNALIPLLRAWQENVADQPATLAVYEHEPYSHRAEMHSSESPPHHAQKHSEGPDSLPLAPRTAEAPDLDSSTTAGTKSDRVLPNTPTPCAPAQPDAAPAATGNDARHPVLPSPERSAVAWTDRTSDGAEQLSADIGEHWCMAQEKVPPPPPKTDPEDPDDEILMGGWEEDPTLSPPPTDLACVESAAATQRELSRHSPISTDEDWDDVDIDLPEIFESIRPSAAITPEQEQAIRQLVLEGLKQEWVSEERLASLHDHTEDPVPGDESQSELDAHLRLLLGELGILVEDVPEDFDTPVLLSHSDIEKLEDDVSEALSFLKSLGSDTTAALSIYLRNLPATIADRDAEMALAEAVERGVHQTLTAVGMSRSAITSLRDTLRSVENGVMPPDSLLSLGSMSPQADPDLEDAAPQQEDSDENLDPDLSNRLAALRKCCDDLLDCREDMRLKRSAEQLATLLAALPVSQRFTRQLCAVALQDALPSSLTAQIESGLASAKAAGEELFRANLRLAAWVARKYGGLTYMDRTQEASMGLMRAIDRFDHRRGVKFSTYAVWWIRQAITRAVADTDRLVRLPVHVHESLRKIRRAMKEYDSCVPPPTIEELAERIGMPAARVAAMLEWDTGVVSLDSDGIDLERELAHDMLAPSAEDICCLRSVRRQIRKLIAGLDAKEQQIICMRYGIGYQREYTLEAVGQEFGVTRERIRQIEMKIFKKLEHPTRRVILEALRDE